MDGPRTPAQTAQVETVLAAGRLEIVGRIVEASNVALLVAVTLDDGEPIHAIYKPIRGERPLWDFPHGTLAEREVASARIAEATGYAVVPPTVLREGPMGTGSVQLWIGDPFAAELPADTAPVRVVAQGKVPAGFLEVIDGELGDGSAVTVVHEDRSDLRDAAVLDAILNNSDRKGSHLVRDGHGVLWGFDHGLTLHAEPKLRTVLWGWAGQPLREFDLTRLRSLGERLADPTDTLAVELGELLPSADLEGLRARVSRLVAAGCHPRPGRGWPSIPWPAL